MWGSAIRSAVAVGVLWTLGAADACARELVVGVEAIDYASLYAWRDGQYTGAARQILDAFAQDSGHRLIYRAYPVRRLLAELVHGGIDLKFPDNPAWQTAARLGVSITYSKPVITYIDGSVVRQDRKGGGVGTVGTLGTVAGFTPIPWADQLKGGKVDLRENPNFEQLLRQLATGRVDAAYANVAVALTVADATLGTPGAIVFDPDLPHIRDSYRLSSATAPAIIAEFDRWMDANGRLVAEIIARTGAERGLR